MVEITTDNFETTVLKSSKPVMIDFWATWCGPCQMQGPVFAEVESEASDTAVFGKVNVDEQMELALKYGVSSIPTIMIFKNGELAYRVIGLQNKDALLKALAEHA